MSVKLYLVTCDLLLGGDYRSSREKLRTMQAHQTLHFQWALRSTKTAAELKNELRQFIDDGDRIVVAEIGAEWASRRALANLGEM